MPRYPDPVVTSGPQESLADRAYLMIREWVLRGELPLGAPLSRRQLADRLSMSVLPVSEALQRLEAEGLVETRYRAGTRVKAPTVQEIRDLYIVREALETQAARLVAERATPQQRQNLRRDAEQVDVLFDRGAQHLDDTEFQFTVHHEHFQLHMRIAEYAGSRSLQDAIEKKQVLIFNWLYMVATPERRVPRHFHGELIEAVTGPDPEVADRAMRSHVRFGLEDLLVTIQPPDSRKRKWRMRTSNTPNRLSA